MTKRILMADDSAVIQSLSRKIFENQGFEFFGTKTGKKLLEEFVKNKYDLVILDIILPDMNGMEIAQKIREMEDASKASVPIIAVSGNYQNFSKDDFTKAGVNEFLIKPLNYDLLVTTVNKYIS